MGARIVGRSCRLYLGTRTPCVLGVGGDVALTIWHVTYVRIGPWRSGRNIIVSARIVSAVRIALHALFSLPLKTSPPVPPASTEARSPLSLLPPPSEVRGVADEALGVSRASSSPSSCTRSRGEGGAGGVVAGSGAASADSSLMGRGGGVSAVIPPSQPSPVLARSSPLPGLSGLLMCDSVTLMQPRGIA